MNKSRNSLIIIILIVLGLIYWFFLRGSSVMAPATTDTSSAAAPISATFNCTDGKSIAAVFTTDEVALTLSDGRSLTLPHALSADGARYANSDESFVFWNKGNTAFIQENGTTTYTDCATGRMEQ